MHVCKLCLLFNWVIINLTKCFILGPCTYDVILDQSIFTIIYFKNESDKKQNYIYIYICVIHVSHSILFISACVATDDQPPYVKL